MPVLDLKVWMDEDGNLLHQHYEKDVSSREVLHSLSAQSSSCKRNVHIQEILRRMLNTSPKLDWQTCGAPVITDYMGRMREAGYGEGMRRDVLQHSARIYARMRRGQGQSTGQKAFRGWREGNPRLPRNTAGPAGGVTLPLSLYPLPLVENWPVYSGQSWKKKKEAVG